MNLTNKFFSITKLFGVEGKALDLVKGGILLAFLFGIFNVLNFAFHFFMARELSIEDYGSLAALFSMVYMIGFFSESIQTIITKYTATLRTDGKLKDLFKRSLRKAIKLAVFLFLVNAVISIFLAKKIAIGYPLLILNSLMIFVIFLTPLNRGILQGKKRFLTLGFNMVLESGVKLVLSILLVYLGWSLYGAIVGTVLGSIVAYGISFFSLKKVLNSKAEHSDVGDIYAYTKPVFLFITGVIVFYGLDLFLAKIFFDPETSGSYAIASILAKIIFLATQPIGKVMFPLSVEEGNHKKKSSKLIMTSLSLISFIILFALSIFYLFPDTLIMLFSGKSIPGLSRIILLLGIGASLLSITNFVLLYKLSIGKIGRPYFIFLFILIEAVLLSVFSQNILVFSVAYVLSSSLFLFGALFFMGDN